MALGACEGVFSRSATRLLLAAVTAGDGAALLCSPSSLASPALAAPAAPPPRSTGPRHGRNRVLPSSPAHRVTPFLPYWEGACSRWMQRSLRRLLISLPPRPPPSSPPPLLHLLSSRSYSSRASSNLACVQTVSPRPSISSALLPSATHLQARVRRVLRRRTRSQELGADLGSLAYSHLRCRPCDRVTCTRERAPSDSFSQVPPTIYPAKVILPSPQTLALAVAHPGAATSSPLPTDRCVKMQMSARPPRRAPIDVVATRTDRGMITLACAPARTLAPAKLRCTSADCFGRSCSGA